MIGSAQLMRGFPKAEFSLTQRTYTCEWLVTVSSYDDGPVVAQSASGLPVAFDTYSIGNDSDVYARLRKWSAHRSEDNSLQWIVSGEWSTPEPKSGSNQNAGGGSKTDAGSEYTNPLAELPTIKCSTVDREIVIQGVYNTSTGLWNPPRNSACEVFSPPLMRHSKQFRLSISRNEALTANHPLLGIQYGGSTNSDFFWGSPPGTWMCEGINPARAVKQIQGGTVFAFFQVEYTFLAKSEGWDLQVLDAGNYYCGACTGCPDCLGGGSGSSASGSFSGDSCTTCGVKNAFFDKNGHPRKGLLNGRGGCLPTGANPIYLTLRPYARLPFSFLALPNSFTGCQ